MAAYAQPGFVAVITDRNGKPYREYDENGRRTARVPFGTEYKIRLKNKTKFRALASVTIDGTTVTGLGKIILAPGQTLDLERFLEDKDAGARFKFVSADSSGVQDPTSEDNGRIQVTFEGEDTLSTILRASGAVISSTYTGPIGGAGGLGYHSGILRSSGMISGAGGSTCQTTYATNTALVNSVESRVNSDVGATVEGSASTQAFRTSWESFATYAPVLVDIWLKGPKVDSPKPFKVSYQDNQGVVFFNGQPLDLKHFSLTSEGLVLTIKPEHFQIA